LGRRIVPGHYQARKAILHRRGDPGQSAQVAYPAAAVEHVEQRAVPGT
jgi:hypothetical protein